MTAASATVRVIGPTASWVNEQGITPARLIRPRVGRMPTRLFAEDGDRIEFTVSEPVPTAAKLAAKAAPVPPEDPPGVRVSSYGFFVCPPSELTVMPVIASSCMFAFPRISAPFSRSRVTVNASFAGCMPLSASDPPVVGISAVSQVVLQHYWNALQGLELGAEFGAVLGAELELFVHGIGLLQHVGVHVQHGIERGPLLVVRLDAVQVLLHQAV